MVPPADEVTKLRIDRETSLELVPSSWWIPESAEGYTDCNAGGLVVDVLESLVVVKGVGGCSDEKLAGVAGRR